MFNLKAFLRKTSHVIVNELLVSLAFAVFLCFSGSDLSELYAEFYIAAVAFIAWAVNSVWHRVLMPHTRPYILLKIV